jgi:hypothetical protein
MSDLPPLPAEGHVCATCPLRYPDTGLADALLIIDQVPGRTAIVARAVPEPALRTRPEPGTWSALEYVCHLRDVYMTSTIRLHRVRTEDHPVFEPMLNELRARRFGYRTLDLDAVLLELGAAVAGFHYETGRMPEQGWERTGSRLPGEQRTALWLVRHAAHEGLHHVHDIAARVPTG